MPRGRAARPAAKVGTLIIFTWRAQGDPTVANRFGLLYAALDIHGGPTEAVLHEALEWVDLAQRQCGECFAPLDWD